jgi:hypothetical protein
MITLELINALTAFLQLVVLGLIAMLFRALRKRDSSWEAPAIVCTSPAIVKVWPKSSSGSICDKFNFFRLPVFVGQADDDALAFGNVSQEIGCLLFGRNFEAIPSQLYCCNYLRTPDDPVRRSRSTGLIHNSFTAINLGELIATSAEYYCVFFAVTNSHQRRRFIGTGKQIVALQKCSRHGLTSVLGSSTYEILVPSAHCPTGVKKTGSLIAGKMIITFKPLFIVEKECAIQCIGSLTGHQSQYQSKSFHTSDRTHKGASAQGGAV